MTDGDLTWPSAVLSALPDPGIDIEATAALACATASELVRMHAAGFAQGSVALVQLQLAPLRLRMQGLGAPGQTVPGLAARADLQALGHMLYRCVLARPQAAIPAAGLRHTLPATPRALCDVIAALCQSDAVRPYCSAAAARADLALARSLLLDGRTGDTFSLARHPARAA